MIHQYYASLVSIFVLQYNGILERQPLSVSFARDLRQALVKALLSKDAGWP